MLDDLQRRELGKPLDRANVKTREQSGHKLSYIEGWHAIAEANRIFGFDGWSRETIDIRCVAEGPRQIGKTNPQPGHGVSYIAKVRVNVGGIIRDGCGTGHGIDRDLGQAHESALKEAETDAMKRALMTFGNPFGLALYDKTQADVVDVLTKKAARPAYLAMLRELDGFAKAPELQAWLASNKDSSMRPLPDDWQSNLVSVVETKVAEIRNGRQPSASAEILSEAWSDKQAKHLQSATRAHDEEQVEWTDDTPPEWDSAWEKLGPVKQAGVLCSDSAFHRFLAVANADLAAKVVRDRCRVKSRADLATNDEAAKLWRALVADYRAWQREPDLGSSHAATESPPAAAPDSPTAGGLSIQDEAREAAKRGVFQAFWNRISAADKRALEPLGAELRKLMVEAGA